MNTNTTAPVTPLTLDFAPLEAGVNSVLAALGGGPQVLVPLDEVGDDMYAGIAAYVRDATTGLTATA